VDPEVVGSNPIAYPKEETRLNRVSLILTPGDFSAQNANRQNGATMGAVLLFGRFSRFELGKPVIEVVALLLVRK
jgi:hypothetical protein